MSTPPEATAARPQPQTTQESEFFWTSGHDGRLRFQHCTACEALIHPPQPVCRHCRSHATAVREVSGRATLIGFTLNHRFPFPGLPSPFVVAQVAIEEDPRVRLTTNLVDCAPEDLRLGMRMEVVFERAGETWLPLFRPTAQQSPPAPLPPDDPAPERMRAHVRTPSKSRKFEERAVISGAGASRLGRRLMVPPLELTVEACEKAVADAGLTFDDIDGLSTYPGGGVYGGFAEEASPPWSRPSGCARSGTTAPWRPSAPAAPSSPRCSPWPPDWPGTCCASVPCGRPRTPNSSGRDGSGFLDRQAPTAGSNPSAPCRPR